MASAPSVRDALTLAETAFADGQFDAALRATEFVIQALRHSEGSEELAEAVHLRAAVLEKTSAFDEAFSTATAAIELRRRQLGRTHPLVAHSLRLRGSIAVALERWDAAMEDLDEAVEILEAAGEPERLNLVACRLTMGDAALTVDEYAAADSLYRRVIHDLSEVECRTDDEVRWSNATSALALRGLALALFLRGEQGEARTMAERALVFAEAAEGKKHPFTSSIARSLGEILSRPGGKS